VTPPSEFVLIIYRISGIINREFVVLDKTSDGLYHGHVRSWGELDQKMQAILRKAGLVDKKGNIK
jgi:hypothetical protein